MTTALFNSSAHQDQHADHGQYMDNLFTQEWQSLQVVGMHNKDVAAINMSQEFGGRSGGGYSR